MTTVLVTGATDGLGRGVAAELSRRGMKVLVHGRDRSRAEAAAEEIGAAGVHLADLSSFAQVRELADELPPLDILVNNAGVISQERVVTEDGCELTLQVNHLSHFLLTQRLLDGDGRAPQRVVHVASAGQQALDFDDLMLERDYEPWRAYRQSKLAQIMFSNELAERRPDVESTSLHPATFMDTKMVRQTIREPHSTVEEGIEATVRLIADPDLPVTGRYFNGQREATPDAQAQDPEARRRLWELSEQLTA
jgi:NAD(P)-dependent dehydrogenase (short-subunit alcohol dehydrogenase family)